MSFEKQQTSPYIIIKRASHSKYKLYIALEKIREFRKRKCMPLEIDSNANFILNGNPIDDFLICSLNALNLGDLNYCICDFLNSIIENSDVSFLSEMSSKLKFSQQDYELDHKLISFFRVSNRNDSPQEMQKILPFGMLNNSDSDRISLQTRYLDKESHLSTREITCMVHKYMNKVCDLSNSSYKRSFLVKNLDNIDLESTDFIQDVCEGLNFVRLFNKPCTFIVKAQALHFGCIIIPLSEINKYKFLIISKPLNNSAKKILDRIREISDTYNLLKNNYFLSGQYLVFDYNFNASFDVKIALSLCTIVPYYALDKSLCSTKEILRDLERWNKNSFSVIEEFINSIHSTEQVMTEEQTANSS